MATYTVEFLGLQISSLLYTKMFVKCGSPREVSQGEEQSSEEQVFSEKTRFEKLEILTYVGTDEIHSRILYKTAETIRMINEYHLWELIKGHIMTNYANAVGNQGA